MEDSAGRLQRRFSSDRVNFKNAEGVWTPVDTDFRARDGRYRQKANDLGVEVAGRADDQRLTRIEFDGGRAVAARLQGARAVTPIVSGSEARFSNVLPDTDVQFLGLSNGIKETLILKSAAAPTSWVFPLDLQGLTARLNGDGGVDYVDQSGAIVAGTPRGFMTDANIDPRSGEAARSDAVTYELITVNGTQALRVSVDATWVRSPARVFPIQVDPTTFTRSTNGTTYVDRYVSRDNSTLPQIVAGTYDNGTHLARGFMRWGNLSSPPFGTRVTGATLNLFLSYASSCTPTEFVVQTITQDWAPATTKTYPGPNLGSQIGSLSPNPGVACSNPNNDPNRGVWVAVPLSTAPFQNWTGYYGLAVKAANTGTTSWKRFNSNNTAQKPYLTLTYTENVAPQVDATAPAPYTDVATLTPELSATGHDPDAYPNPTLQYRFKVVQIVNEVETTLTESGWIAAGNWVVPAGILRWSKSYAWTVEVSDGFPYPGGVYPRVGAVLTTKVPQPEITSTLTRASGGRGFDPNSGNVTTSTVDATVATIGPPLSIERVYNSRDPRTAGAFGSGWSSVLDMAATERATPGTSTVSSVVITYPDGEQVGFGLNPDGSWAAPPGRYATLKSVTGGYSLTDKDGTVYAFTQARSGTGGAFGIRTITDAAGRALTFTWTGDLITRAQGASQRGLTLTWTTVPGAAPHVTAVTTDRAVSTDPGSAQLWSYTYTGNRLVRACPPTSLTACTTYTYDDGSHYPTTVLDTRPRAYWRFADSSGTVAADSVATNQGAWNARYTNVGLNSTASPIAHGAVKAADFNGNSWVTLPADLASQFGTQSLSVWFKTTTGDRVLVGYHGEVQGTPTTPGNYIPALYIGNDNKLRGQLGYGALGAQPIASAATVTDGNWHLATITATGGPTPSQTMYLDGVAVGTRAMSGYYGVPTTLTVGAGYIGAGWPNQSRYSTTSGTGYASYFVGSISDVAVHSRALNAGEVAAMWAQASAAPAALLNKTTLASGRTGMQATYLVDRDMARTVTDSAGGTWTLEPLSVTGSSNGLVGAVRAANPAVYWRLNEQVGTQAVDTLAPIVRLGDYSNVTLGRTGPFGLGDATAAQFNGVNSHMQAPPSVSLADGQDTLSVGMWFKTSAAFPGVLFSYSRDPVTTPTTPGNYVPALYIGNDGKLRGQLWTGSVGPITSSTPVNDGKWHFVALAGSLNIQTLYLDGLPIGNKSGTIQATGMPVNTVGAGFLGHTWPAQPHLNSSAGHAISFTGEIAEVSGYYDALLPEQVSAQWQAYKSATTTSPILNARVIDPTGKIVQNSYEPTLGYRLVRYTNSLGHTTTFSYNTAGFSDSVTDPDGFVTTTQRDARGNLLARTTCADQELQACSMARWTYPDPATFGSTDPRTDQPVAFYDPRTRVEPDQPPTSPTYRTAFAYTPAGQPRTVTGPAVAGFPEGRVTTMTYTDASTAAEGGGNPPPGLMASVTTPGGAKTSYTYYANGDLATVTDPLGLITRYAFDGLGHLISATEISDTHPLGLVTTFTYDAQDRVLTRTDPPRTDAVSGVVHTARTTYTYDDDSHVLTTTVTDLTGGDPARTARVEIGDNGKPETVTDPVGNGTTYSYDVYGNPQLVTYPDDTEIARTFDSESQLLTTTLKDFAGDSAHPSGDLVTESRAYDPAGRLASVTDAMGWKTTYSYYDNGLLADTKRVNPLTQAQFLLAHNGYDDAGNLVTQITQDSTATTEYTVDPAGRVEQMLFDRNGLARGMNLSFDGDDYVTNATLTQGSIAQSIDAEWNDAGNLVRRTVHDGSQDKTERWEYDRRGLPTSYIDQLGNRITFVNDEAGVPTVVTAPSVPTETGVEGQPPVQVAASTRTGYNTFGEPVSTMDPNRNVTVIGYDPAGRILSTTAAPYTPPGASEALPPSRTARTYDAMGRLKTLTDPLENQSSFGYDQFGNLTSLTAPGDATTRFTYNVNGELLSTTSPTGARQESTWDYLGRRLTATTLERATETSPSAAYTSDFTYGAGGWLTKHETPDRIATTYTHNAAGEITEATDGAGNKTEYGYDLLGRAISVTWPDDSYQTLSYNVAGNLIGTADYSPTGTQLRSTTASYDLAGRLISATDGRGHATTWTHDALGAVVSQTEPVTATAVITSTFAHDPAGNPTRFTDGRENSFLTRYNSWNLPETRTEPATAAHPALGQRTWTTSYDANGRPLRTDAPGGVFQVFGYDVRGNLTSHTGGGAETPTEDRTFSYDKDDYLETATAPGDDLAFTWNDRGLLAKVTGAAGESSFGYTADGRMASRTDAAGATSYTWDTAGRLKTLTDPLTATTQTRSYDALSRLKTIAYGAGGATRAFAYDDLHRLSEDTLTAPNGAQEAKITYGYDRNDNLTTKTTAGTAGAGTNTYGYDRSNRLTSWTAAGTTTDYDYDAAGNRTAINGRPQVFDARNRLTSATGPTGTTTYTWAPRGTLAGTTGAATRQASFDAFDQMITDTGPAGTQTYTYDSLGRQLTATPSTGPASTFSYSGAGNHIAADGTASYSRSPSGKLAATRSGPASALTLTDRHDDVVGAFTATGNALVGSTSYDPFGVPTANGGILPGRLGYQSGWTDPVTGTVNAYSRRYDPAIASFNSRDTANLSPQPASGTANRYSYIGGNPLAGTDPLGYAPCFFDRLNPFCEDEPKPEVVEQIPTDPISYPDPSLPAGCCGFDPPSTKPKKKKSGSSSSGGSTSTGSSSSGGTSGAGKSSGSKSGTGKSGPAKPGSGTGGGTTGGGKTAPKAPAPPRTPANTNPDYGAGGAHVPTPADVPWDDILPGGTAAAAGGFYGANPDLTCDGSTPCVWGASGIPVPGLPGPADGGLYGAAPGSGSDRCKGLFGGLKCFAENLTLREVIAFGAGVVVGSVVFSTCTASTFGFGVVACGFAAGAAGGFTTSALNGASAKDVLVGTLIGGATGGALGAAGGVLGRLLRGPKPTGGSSAAEIGAARSTAVERYEPYPPASTSAGGFVGGASVPETLIPGSVISRYGLEGGRYASPIGTPFAKRGLPPSFESEFGDSLYQIAKPIDVDAGIAAYWQGGGGGVQYRLPDSISNLIENGFLKRYPQ